MGEAQRYVDAGGWAMSTTDKDELRASLLSHLREEGIEYTMTGHGVGHEFAEVDEEFATIHAAYVAAHAAVEAWMKRQGTAR